MVSIAQPGRTACRLIFLLVMVAAFYNVSLAQDVDSQSRKGAKPLQSVNLEITTHLGDQQSFVEQDVISFFITLDQATFLYAFYQDASDHVYQLIPGQVQPEHFFQAGFYIPFPAANSAFQFVVQAPFGEEQIWLFASDNGQLEFAGKDSTQGIKQLKQRRSTLADSIKAASERQFGEASLTIHTRRR